LVRTNPGVWENGNPQGPPEGEGEKQGQEKQIKWMFPTGSGWLRVEQNGDRQRGKGCVTKNETAKKKGPGPATTAGCLKKKGCEGRLRVGGEKKKNGSFR